MKIGRRNKLRRPIFVWRLMRRLSAWASHLPNPRQQGRSVGERPHNAAHDAPHETGDETARRVFVPTVMVMRVTRRRRRWRRRRAAMNGRGAARPVVMRRGIGRSGGERETREDESDCLDDLVHVTPATFFFAVPQEPFSRLRKGRRPIRRFLTGFFHGATDPPFSSHAPRANVLRFSLLLLRR